MMRPFCQQVFSVLQTTANVSVRAIAQVTGIPRSSVQRYKAGIARRKRLALLQELAKDLNELDS